jgi:threonine/homoserine/homoserine lactone efflux protein
MTELFPPWPLLGAFIAASVMLAVTPGPGVLYIVARSLGQGRHAGLASVAGIALGNLVNAIGAAVGLAALFMLSSVAFTVVKYLGAAYLVFLGIRVLRNASRPNGPPAAIAGSRGHGAFRDGLVVALLNPKTTMFYAAFLPQFMGVGADPMLQGITLGTLFVAIAALTDSLYALAAARVGPTLRGRSGLARGGRWLSGGTLIGLGVAAALAERR